MPRYIVLVHEYKHLYRKNIELSSFLYLSVPEYKLTDNLMAAFGDNPQVVSFDGETEEIAKAKADEFLEEVRTMVSNKLEEQRKKMGKK